MKPNKNIKKFVEDWVWYGKDPEALDLNWDPQQIKAIIEIVSAYHDTPNQEVSDSQAWVCPGPESCEIAICLGCGNWCSDYPPATEL